MEREKDRGRKERVLDDRREKREREREIERKREREREREKQEGGGGERMKDCDLFTRVLWA